jgi:AhpD family alkylhydroperoxidase
MSEVRNPHRKAATGPAFPEAYQHLLDMSRLVNEAAEAAGLDPKLIELIKIRASQLNGCAFCLDMHAHDARKHGEEERRLYLLPAWRETTLFDEQERAALALTEQLTTLSQHQDVSDEVYDRAAEVFTQRQLTVVVWAATVINTFNRFGVAGRPRLPARA